MALGTPVAAAAAYSASGGTSVAPAYPAGILATDSVVLFVGQKPSTANGGTVTTPTGWTLRDELTGAGGYGTTLGADTGNTNLRVYTWNTPVAGQTGNLTVTLGVNNISWAFMVRVPTGGGTLSYGSADGQRTTTPTSPMAIALTNGATATNFEAGDKAIWAMCIPTDVTTPAQFSAEAVTATGATFATATEINEPDSTLGNDIGGYSAYAHVNSGSSTTAPTVTATLAGTLTNVRGPVVLLRIREAAAAPITGTGAATDTGVDTAASSGDVLVDGAGAASDTGADTASASGTVTDAGVTGDGAAAETGSDTLSATGIVRVQGAGATAEVGSDTAAGAGDVIVKGSAALAETGADTAASTGDVIVQGSGAATETGVDTAAGSGSDVVTGTGAALEAGTDTLSAEGIVRVTGAAALQEAGDDTASATGTVTAAAIIGDGAALETGSDIAAASGQLVSVITGDGAAIEIGDDIAAASGQATVGVSGYGAATEAGSDTIGGYVEPGYAEPGYFGDGVYGYLGPVLPEQPSNKFKDAVAGGPGTQVPLSAMRKKQRTLTQSENDDDEEAIALLLCALVSRAPLDVIGCN